jgi:hypothetical protein
VSLAKELARDAFLKAVTHDGVDIHTVGHFGPTSGPSFAPHSSSARLRTSMALPAVRRVAGVATASSGTTSTPSPTAARLPTRTSNPNAGPITERRPNRTAGQVCSMPPSIACPNEGHRRPSVLPSACSRTRRRPRG